MPGNKVAANRRRGLRPVGLGASG